MADAREIAKYLTAIGFDPEAPGESVLVCPLRLQKLLYYCQGWSLALLGRPLFRQPIEAWTMGPVVRDVFAAYAGQKNGITPDAAEVAPPAGLSESEAALVRTVWREYIRYRPNELVRMTHREPPWVEARAGLPADAQCSTALSTATMAAFFSDQARRKGAAQRIGTDPAEEWRATDAWEKAGKPTVAAEDLFGELLAASPR